MPTRRAFGAGERRKALEVFDYYAERDSDPCYEGHFEKEYCAAFVEMMGDGYADSVATGTASIYVALAALDLPKSSEVIISPITDAGSVNAVIMQGHQLVVADSKPGSYNMGIDEFAARITPKTKALVLVHCLGEPTEVDAIVEFAHARGIKVLEDCSQAHGARWKGKPVGSFGDVAAFSTMFKKAHSTGASGGVVYTRDLDLHRMGLAHADRGKPRWSPEFDDRSPITNLFPALNWNTDEISCAIGCSSLGRLGETIRHRLAFIDSLAARLPTVSRACRPYGHTADFSPFIYPIFVDQGQIDGTKKEFAEAVRAEGIDLNPHYGFTLSDWPWLRPYLSDDFSTPNARDARDRSFCLYLNERYTEREVDDTLMAIAKVERWMSR